MPMYTFIRNKKIFLPMPIAFVLVNTVLGEGSSVDDSLKEIDEVKEVWPVYGVYDYVVKIETDNMTTLKDTIAYKIRRIARIRSSLTLITIE
jgi:DNA-binding Lrp family transcriptional regulator